jgi:hypothetical protein
MVGADQGLGAQRPMTAIMASMLVSVNRTIIMTAARNILFGDAANAN